MNLGELSDMASTALKHLRILQGVCHSAPTHDDDRNSLSKKALWPRGSAEGRLCGNVGVRMG